MFKFFALLLFFMITLMVDEISGNLFTSEPSPPENPSIQIRGNDTAIINWAPPLPGDCSGYRVRVFSRDDTKIKLMIDIPPDKFSVVVGNLTAGQTYFFHISTILNTKESVPYMSEYFTTIPNRPGRSSLLFRNETTLRITWLPPSPLGIFTHYMIDLAPPFISTTTHYLEHHENSVSPNEITFNNLIPGKLYTIIIKTISQDKKSHVEFSNYRTIPLIPSNLMADKILSTPKTLRITWNSPNITSVFTNYEISLSNNDSTITRIRNKDVRWIEFDNLIPGKTYYTTVRTVSNELSSYPLEMNVTMEPLPVRELEINHDKKTDSWIISWKYDKSSIQDSFKLQIECSETFGTVISTVRKIELIELLNKPKIQVDDLLPGRNYTIFVQTLSNNIESKKKIIHQLTEPSSPMIDQIIVNKTDLMISWKSDVDSRQKFYKVMLKNYDDNQVKNYTTIETMIVMKNIFPGCYYKISVCAINYDVESEFTDDSVIVPPSPPKDLHLSELWSDTSLFLRWNQPIKSVFSGFTVAFIGSNDKNWTILPDTNNTEIEINNLIQGEKYAIRVNSISYGVESLNPIEIEYILRPRAVWNLTIVPETTKINLLFERPPGKIDYYHVQWRIISNSNDNSIVDDNNYIFKNFTATNVYPFVERISIDDLMPYENYFLMISTVSHHFMSHCTKFHVQTKKSISEDYKYQFLDKENNGSRQNSDVYLELLNAVR